MRGSIGPRVAASYPRGACVRIRWAPYLRGACFFVRPGTLRRRPGHTICWAGGAPRPLLAWKLGVWARPPVVEPEPTSSPSGKASTPRGSRGAQVAQRPVQTERTSEGSPKPIRIPQEIPKASLHRPGAATLGSPPLRQAAAEARGLAWPSGQADRSLPFHWGRGSWWPLESIPISPTCQISAARAAQAHSSPFSFCLARLRHSGSGPFCLV